MGSTDNTRPLLAQPDDLAVVLVDSQPRFIETMHGDPEPVLARLEQLLITSAWFRLPVLATFEEPVEAKGRLPERLDRVFPAGGLTFSKQAFAITGESQITTAIEQLGRRQLAVAGAETDVCILQSVLGLIELGYQVFLLQDCLFSSEPQIGPALTRMYAAGAIPCTYKMLFYELLETNDPAPWQEQQQQAIERGFQPPESMPPSA